MASFTEKRPNPKTRGRFLMVRLTREEQQAIDRRVEELRKTLLAQGFEGSVVFAVNRSSVARGLITKGLRP